MKEIGCPVCSIPMTVRIARGRKSNKPFLMMVCPRDGRHFRGFISDQAYVRGVLSDAEKGMGTGVGVPAREKGQHTTLYRVCDEGDLDDR